LETRTVLATSLAGLGAPGLGSIQNAVPLLRLVTLNAVPSQAASPPGQGNAPGAANGGSSQSGGTNSTPLPPTAVGGNLLTNPSNPTSPTPSTTAGQPSSSSTSSGTDTSSFSAQQNSIAASPFLLSSGTSQATPTNNNTTGNPSTQRDAATSQSLLLIVLNQPLLVAGASQRAETVAVITAAQSSPEEAVTPQILASARASANPQLRILLGNVPLSGTDAEEGDDRDEDRKLDKPMIPEKAPPKPPKQEKNELKQTQPDDKDVAPVVPLEEAMLGDESVSRATSDACFAIWEAEMAPANHETQPPVPASAEESPNWSVAALGLALGGIWGMSPARPREERKRHPAWPARPTHAM